MECRHCGHPAPGSQRRRIALQTRLVGDADGLVSDVQAIAPAIDALGMECELRRFDQARAQQDAIARHADDVALQPTEVGEEYFHGLLLALRPALGNPPVGVGPGADQVAPPVRRCGGQLRLAGDLIDARGFARDLAIVAERKRHLGRRHDRRAHERLAGADRQQSNAPSRCAW
jgi:hypothetical protein